MSARALAVLAVLLAVLGGAALLYQRQQAAERPRNADVLGKPLLENLRAADVAAIKISEPKRVLTVQRKDDGWVLAERGDFAADVAKVREFVLKMLELKVGQSMPVGEAERARLNLDDSGTRVALHAVDGKPLATLIVGKKYFKRAVEDPEKADADGRFVALPGRAGTAYVVADALAQASARSADWIDRTSFQVEKVKSLEVRFADGGGWKIERAADDADWRLAGAAPGEKLDVAKANAASYSLSMLELADVAPKDAADTGLDRPTVIEASTLDGLAYTVRVGKAQDDSYYVTFSSSGTVQGKDDDERIKRLKARLPREKRLSDYVLLIPRSKLEDTLKPRAELLEQKAQR
ncbi:MAG TPA: DUF4340 domain-containing protein [Burkholderiales bacterium]